jgi:hypothetical protein
LYYRSVKGTPYKWLDPLKLFQTILRPTNDIARIRYFTADVSGKRDPGAPIRQQVYLRALSTIPQVSIHKGRFLSSTKWAALAKAPPDFVKPDPVTVFVVKTEEKGSDVNLATYLVRDAFRNEFDVAVVVSNDTDLVEPIRIVAGEVGTPVGLVCPSPSPARSLTRVATFCRYITSGRLAAAQFPDPIPGTRIHKPPTW